MCSSDLLDPANGKIDFEFPWKPAISASVSASVPLVIGDQVFISASYQAGAALLRVRDGGPETVWSGDDILSSQYATSVQRDGFLYGVEGRADLLDDLLVVKGSVDRCAVPLGCRGCRA